VLESREYLKLLRLSNQGLVRVERLTPLYHRKNRQNQKPRKKDSKIDSFKNPKSKKSSQKDKSFKAESIKDKSIV